MTNEEMQQTMQFILNQQAQTTVMVDRIADKVDQIAGKVDRIAEKVDVLTEKVDRLADAQLKYEARTSRLEESFVLLVRLAESTDERWDEVSQKMSEFGDKMTALTDAQIRTDENIRNLAAAVSRYFSEGRNGEPQP